MLPAGDKTCPQCSRPIKSESHSGICASCHSGLFALGTEGFEPDPADPDNHPLESAQETWPRLDTTLPDHDLIRTIGRGGMGSVLQLYNRRLERHEALKVLLPELARRPRFVERFLRESKVLAQLSHPNIVKLYDCADSDETLYILSLIHI